MKKLLIGFLLVFLIVTVASIAAEINEPQITRSYGAVSSTTYFKDFNEVFTGDWQKYGQTFTNWQSNYFNNIYIGILVVVPLIFLLHYIIIGPMKFSHEGEQIPWFSIFSRIIHWIAAVAFTCMVLTGLAIIFGKIFGGGAFVRGLRYIHGVLAVIFMADAVVMFFMWVKDAFPVPKDLKWFLIMGGYLSKVKKPIDDGKFNAGQKVWFWLGTIGGLVMGVTGYIIFFFSGEPDTLRISVMIHIILGMFLVAMFFVHLYMSIFAIKGSLKSMINGHKPIDEAKILHNGYYEKLKNEGYISE